MLKSRTPSFYLALSSCLVLLLLFRDIVLLTPAPDLYTESGSIEIATVILLLWAAGLWFLLRPDSADRRNWHIPVILLLMGMRELDFDKRFTAEGVMQLRLYSGDAPLVQKLIGAAVLVLILTCAWRLLRVNLRPWWQGLMQGQPTSWLVLLGGGLLVVAKTMDGFDRKMASFGIVIDPALAQILGRSEELIELVMAMLIVQAVACYAWSKRSSGRAITAMAWT